MEQNGNQAKVFPKQNMLTTWSGARSIGSETDKKTNQ